MTLGTATSRPASASAKMRAWLAMLCVSLFVLSGFVHAIQHVETIVVATVELSAQGADADDPDSPEKPGVTTEHCCGCASVAYLPVVNAEMPSTVRCGVTPPPTLQLAGHTTAYEPPPPKALT